MYRYYQRIPEAAVFREIDGNLYANVSVDFRRGFRGRATAVYDNNVPRMVRFGPESFIKNGEAYVYIGAMGDAIAPTMNLPFSVTAVKGEDL